MSSACNPYHSANPEFRRLYVFGAGGHGREIAWLAHQSWDGAVELQFLVDRPQYLRDSVNGVPVGLLEDAEVGADARFIVAIGDPTLRRSAGEACLARGLAPTTLVHPRAEMSGSIVLGEGTVICAGVIVTTNVTIGAHVHVNVSCSVSHDVAIGEYSTLSPGVHVSGHVSIGRGVFIGTGASIINGRDGAPLSIGDGAMIAAGACVTGSVERGAMVAGVPAVRKR